MSVTYADLLLSCLWGDWDLPGAIADAGEPGLEAADYSKFEQWIPRFIRPEVPCDYCRSKHLDCYMRRGIRSCNPCNSLFRGCSLSHTLGEDLSGVNAFDAPAETFLDTLHVVDEDACRDQGTLTGTKPLRSMGGRFGTTTPPVRGDDAPGSSKRNGIRFPRTAVKILRDWLDAHSDHPYPTEREKEELEKATGLKGVQIANWLANARRRGKATRLRPKRAASPSLRPSTAAIGKSHCLGIHVWSVFLLTRFAPQTYLERTTTRHGTSLTLLNVGNTLHLRTNLLLCQPLPTPSPKASSAMSRSPGRLPVLAGAVAVLDRATAPASLASDHLPQRPSRPAATLYQLPHRRPSRMAHMDLSPPLAALWLARRTDGEEDGQQLCRTANRLMIRRGRFSALFALTPLSQSKSSSVSLSHSKDPRRSSERVQVSLRSFWYRFFPYELLSTESSGESVRRC